MENVGRPPSGDQFLLRKFFKQLLQPVSVTDKRPVCSYTPTQRIDRKAGWRIPQRLDETPAHNAIGNEAADDLAAGFAKL